MIFGADWTGPPRRWDDHTWLESVPEDLWAADNLTLGREIVARSTTALAYENPADFIQDAIQQFSKRGLPEEAVPEFGQFARAIYDEWKQHKAWASRWMKDVGRPGEPTYQDVLDYRNR